MDLQQKRNLRSRDYYNNIYDDYNEYYSNDHIHYGYWFEDTKTHEESLINTIKEIIFHLRIHENDLILDAGCGSGGSCRYIANNYNVHVIGIMLSDVLLKAAIKKSSGLNQGGELSFLLNDYHKTSFKDNTFNKIFGLESICYSEDISVFFDEMYRILKRNGIMAIANFFKNKDNLNEMEIIKYHDWLNGWAMSELFTVDEFIDNLGKSGFKLIQFFDNTNYIQKSIELMHNAATHRLLHSFANKRIKYQSELLKNHLISGCLQKELFDNKIINYGIIVAKKIL